MSPIYHSNVPDFTVFINSSLRCVVCFLWSLPKFSDAMTESVVILAGWLTVVTGRNTKVESPLPHTSHFWHSPPQRCAAAPLRWPVRCISEMTKFCSTVSDTSFVFILVSLPSVPKHTLRTFKCFPTPTPSQISWIFCYSVWSTQAGSYLLPVNSRINRMWKRSWRSVLCTAVSLARPKGTLSRPYTS